MTNTGIIRAIDKLNRFTVPAELCRALDLREGAKLQVTVSGTRIILSAALPGSIGILRKMDSLNRITIPQKICTSLKLGARPKFRVSIYDNDIMLTPIRHTCFFCDGEDGLTEHFGTKICKRCISQLMKTMHISA